MNFIILPSQNSVLPNIKWSLYPNKEHANSWVYVQIKVKFRAGQVYYTNSARRVYSINLK